MKECWRYDDLLSLGHGLTEVFESKCGIAYCVIRLNWLLKNILTFHGILKFITMFTTAQCFSYPKSHESSPFLHTTKLKEP
jgi:hypothetical protein